MHRFDTSHKFWKKYGVKNEHLKKKFDYFSIENIDDPYVVTVAVNPKEYFQEFDSQSIKKKHKGLRKGASEFKDYAERINSIREIETFGQLPKEKQKQNSLTIRNNQMILEEIEKSKFSQINNNRYCFSDGIVSLPFSHPFLKEIVNKKQKTETSLQQEKRKLIPMGKFAAQKKQNNFDL